MTGWGSGAGIPAGWALGVVDLGRVGGARLERVGSSRMIAYVVGDVRTHGRGVADLVAYAQRHGWQVVDTRWDGGGHVSAWLRRGLLSAFTVVAHNQADGVLMSASVREGFSCGDRVWIVNRLRSYGGQLHVMPADAGALVSGAVPGSRVG